MSAKADYSRAYEEGQAARRAGKPREANAYRHRGGQDGEGLYDRWHDGWDDENARMTKA